MKPAAPFPCTPCTSPGAALIPSDSSDPPECEGKDLQVSCEVWGGTPFTQKECIRHNALLPLQRLDPAHKLLSALMFSLAVSTLRHWEPAMAACGVAVALIWLGGLHGGMVLRRLAPVNAFFVFLWVIMPWAPAENVAPVDVLFRVGSLAFRFSGCLLPAVITLKGNAIAAMFLALAGTSSLPANGHALLRLRVPAKLVTLLLLTHANLAIMTREYGRLLTAAKLRGFRPRTSLACYRTYAFLAAMLLVRSWQRARRVSIAMRLRGFCGRFPLLNRTIVLPRFRKMGFFLCIGVAVVSSMLCSIDYVAASTLLFSFLR